MLSDWLLAIALLFATALRSFFWTGIGSGITDVRRITLSLALAAGAGKLLGGSAGGRLGWLRRSVVALVLTMILQVVDRNWFAPTLIGAFFLQTVTPLSIAVLGRLMPRTSALI